MSLGGPLGGSGGHILEGNFAKLFQGVPGEVPGASWGSWNPLGRSLGGLWMALGAEGRASVGNMSVEQIQKMSFSCSLEDKCAYFEGF